MLVKDSQGTSFNILGPNNIRGRAEPCIVYQIEWLEDVTSDFLTTQGVLDSAQVSSERDALGREVELTWSGNSQRFRSFELPVQLGRTRDTNLVVNDPRVSRVHAWLEWRNASVVFVVSMYCCAALNVCCMVKVSWYWAFPLRIPAYQRFRFRFSKGGWAKSLIPFNPQADLT